MSLLEHQVTAAQIAANQANCKQSTGPKTPHGKVRSALNALKTGAYARTDNARHAIMLRSGEDPADYDQLQEELTEAWHPDDVMEELLVKSIAEKSFEKACLRAGLVQHQLLSLQLAQFQKRRKELLQRRWCPGVHNRGRAAGGLWLAKDSATKFKSLFDRLDLLEKWCQNQDVPDEYPEVMGELYGETPSLAGEKIRLGFIDLFEGDAAAAEKAGEELPKWIAHERRHVEAERDLYSEEMHLRESGGPSLPEEQVSSREAALESQIARQVRLLLQLKRKGAQRPETAPEPLSTAVNVNSPSEAAPEGASACGPVVAPGCQSGEKEGPAGGDVAGFAAQGTVMADDGEKSEKRSHLSIIESVI